MASDFEQVIDAIAADLIENVPALATAIVHRYAPWDPEELVAAIGERHLAVWPAAEAPESSAPLTTAGHILAQRYVIAYWEYADTESSRQAVDEEAAKEYLQLHNDIRARLYRKASTTTATSIDTWYLGAEFAQRSRSVRAFLISFQSLRPQDFT